MRQLHGSQRPHAPWQSPRTPNNSSQALEASYTSEATVLRNLVKGAIVHHAAAAAELQATEQAAAAAAQQPEGEGGGAADADADARASEALSVM